LHPNEFKFCQRKKNIEKKNEGTGYDNRDVSYLLKNKFGKFGMMSNKFWRGQKLSQNKISFQK
jgi:hypothetical protein